MPIDEKTGQEVGSPPAGEEGLTVEQIAANAAAEAAKGQEGVSSPTDLGEGAVTKTDEDGKTYVEVDGEKFYSSFDTHPEWRELKDAKDEYQGILDRSQFASKEELVAALENGEKLSDLIGEQDAEALVEAANKWNQAEEYWAEQEAAQAEEGETEPQTIARLKQANATLKEQQKTEAERLQENRSSREAIAGFNTEIETAVEAAELAGSESDLAKLVLGKDNPMDDVDIQDKKAVRLAIKDNLGKVSEIVKAIKQSAVDAYVAGDKDVIPIPKDEGGEIKDKGSKFQVKEGETQEEALGRANQRLVEFMNAAGKEQSA
jgi:hypothetical protein